MLKQADVAFLFAAPADLERLTALKLQVMNDQLARIGRLDPVRSAARFAAEFRPGVTRLILCDSRFAGCVTFRAEDEDYVLEHFYLTPECQGHGLGGRVLQRLLDEADAATRAVRLSVLIKSPANRFYPRYGFVETHREAFDIYYRRPGRS